MREEMESGLEVAPGNDPETVGQPDANKYFIQAEQPTDFASNTSLHSGRPDAKSGNWRKIYVLLAVFAIFSLAVAMGAGLGLGLAAQHKSAPSR